MAQLIMAEGAAPSTPGTGKVTVFAKTDGYIYGKDDAGVENPRSGTWTPTIFGSTTAGTNTYTTQIGKYNKIGLMVFAMFYVTINAKDGAMAGLMRVGGLPFTTAALANYFQPVSISFWFSFATNLVELRAYTLQNTTTIAFEAMTAAASGTSGLNVTALQNGSGVSGMAIYEAAS